MIIRVLICVLALISYCLTNASYAQQTFKINEICHVDVEHVQKVKSPNHFIIPEKGWEKTQLPDNWHQTWNGYNGGAWYKLNWKWHCKDQAVLAEPIAFSIDYINSAGAVFLNNDLLWANRNLEEPLSKSWNVPRYWLLPVRGLQQGNNQILVYVTGYSFQKAGLGSIEFSPILSNSEKHTRKVWDRRTLFQINMILSGTLGVICFIIWMFRRAETTFGWLALSTFLWILFISNLLTVESFPFSSSLWAAKANMIFFIAYIHCFCIYILRFLNRKFKRAEMLVLSILAFNILLICFSPIHILYEVLTSLFLAYILLFFVCVIYVTCIAIRTRNGEFVFFALCLIGVVFFAIFDMLMLSQGKFTDFSPLSPYTSPIITLFVVLILGTRLNRNILRIEKFNQELEHKVQQVSADLSQSLTEQHHLELSNVRLQERIHLSHELHDGLGASIVRSMIMVDQSQQNIPNQQFLSMLKLLRDDLRQIIDSGSSSNSKVPETPIFWIAPVRYRFMQLMDELDIKVRWDFPEEWLTEPTALQCLTLIRIVEESLTNIIKHSQASEVEVKLYYLTADQLCLSIQDNGVGFDHESVQQNGLSIGMRSMRMRMERLGGELNIQSEHGRTMIQAILPLNVKV